MTGTHGFFHRHPRFSETSRTGPTAERLERRHRAIIDWNREALRDARVLDLASHDGRWSAAALDAGAAHVQGIEVRPHLIEGAPANVGACGFAEDRFDFVAGDVYTVLRQRQPKVDVVLLLGFFYHVARHVELIRLVTRTGARTVIVDSKIVPDAEVHPDRPVVIAFQLEDLSKEGAQALPEAAGAAKGIVGYPSRAAIPFLFGHFGFEAQEFDWPALIAADPHPDVSDYERGLRTTFRLTRR